MATHTGMEYKGCSTFPISSYPYPISCVYVDDSSVYCTGVQCSQVYSTAQRTILTWDSLSQCPAWLCVKTSAVRVCHGRPLRPLSCTPSRRLSASPVTGDPPVITSRGTPSLSSPFSLQRSSFYYFCSYSLFFCVEGEKV